MIVLKTRADIQKMRHAGQILASVMERIRPLIVPGVTTAELDAQAHDWILAAGATPSFLGYGGFPKSVCISVNEEVVHGIPGKRVVREGDVVGIDLGVYCDGFHADSAWTFAVGEITEEAQRLLRVTEEALFKGIEKAKPGNRIGDVSAAIQKHVESNGFHVVRDLVGHGIGRELHEPPSVPCFGKPGQGPKIKEGMTFCIEPMVNVGTWKVKTLEDKWTVVAADGRYSAHFEHTVAITQDGAEILTRHPAPVAR